MKAIKKFMSNEEGLETVEYELSGGTAGRNSDPKLLMRNFHT